MVLNLSLLIKYYICLTMKAHGRVTVSTVGIASKIRRLTDELPEVSLALSLHAPNQRLRSEIVPTAKHYPIEDMIDALDGHMKAALRPRKQDSNTHHRPANGSSSSRRRAMIEYVMCKLEISVRSVLISDNLAICTPHSQHFFLLV